MHKQDGPWAWFVLGCSFLQSWLLVGVIRGYGVFLPIFMDEFNQGRDTIALISSLGMGGGHLFTVIATWLNTIFQSRVVCFSGHVFTLLAFSLTALVYKIELMYFTYGVFLAVGVSLTAASHVLLIFQYFHRHRSLAQGVNASGGALGMMTVPSIAQWLVDNVGWRNTYHICAGSFGLLSLLCIVFSPHLKLDVVNNNVEISSNQNGRTLRRSDGNANDMKAAVQITEAYDNLNCSDAIDQQCDNNDCQSQSLEYDSQQHTADQTNLSCEMLTIEHDKCENTADQDKQSEAHDNQQYTAGQNENENPAFAHDSHECAAGQPNLSLAHDKLNASDRGVPNSMNDDMCRDNGQGRVCGGETTVNSTDQQKSSKCRGLLDFSVWKNSKFVIAAISIYMGMFGMVSPSIHLVKFSEDVGLTATKAATLYTFMGIASLIGRIASGKLCDISWVRPNILVIISFLLASLGTFLYTFGSTYLHLAVISTIYGLSDGLFRTLFVVILTTCVEPSKAGAAYGQAISISAVFVLAGPAITGLLADKMGGYNIPYYINGCVLIVGAAVLFIPMIHKQCRASRDYAVTNDIPMTNSNRQ